MRTPSSSISHCTEARSESLCGIGVAVNPVDAVGTRNPCTPSSILAHTTATSATDARPIHRFEPVSTQSSPSRAAVVRMLDGSEPAVGSVSAKHPSASPAAMRGSHSCFCSSDPWWRIAVIASDPCTLTSVRMPESPASSSAHASPYSTALRPAQPYPSRCMPNSPAPASAGTTSGVNSPRSYHSAMCGRTVSSTSARTRSRVSSSSALN